MGLRSTVNPTAPDDVLRCQDFGYGLGTPGGILVLRYATSGRLDFGMAREDLHEQLYWAPSGLLVAQQTGQRTCYVGPEEGFWAARAIPHEVCAVSATTVYRVCLRQVPESIRELPAGPVALSPAAATAVVRLSGPGRWNADWQEQRHAFVTGLAPAAPDLAVTTTAGAASDRPGRGYARRVMWSMAHDPADSTPLTEWAAQLHCSAKTLQRDFVATTGLSFTLWRASHRLHMARILLPEMKVADVASAVGYASSSAFVAAYRRAYGLPPGKHSHRNAGTPAPHKAGTPTAGGA